MPNSAVWKYRMFLLHILIALTENEGSISLQVFFGYISSWSLWDDGQLRIDWKISKWGCFFSRLKYHYLLPRLLRDGGHKWLLQCHGLLSFKPTNDPQKTLNVKIWSLFNHLSGKPEKISSAKAPLHFLVPSLIFCKISVFVFLTL